MVAGWRILLAGIALIGLAACGITDSAQVDAPAPAVIQWDRNPLAVVFRAQIVGGDQTVTDVNNTIPDCTIYGDGRLVYPQRNPDGNTEIIFDMLSDGRIEGFVNELTINQRIFTFAEGYPQQAPQSITPVYEQLVLSVSGERHVTDVFANWPAAYYADVLQKCRELALTPRLFAPTGAWISTEPVPIDMMKPQILWDSNAAGFSFTGLAADGSKRWIEGGVVLYLWDQVVTPAIRVQFIDNEQAFDISMQVPGVMLDAPAAPSQ